MKQAKLWYAIADGGRARFVERDEGGEFRTVVSFVSTDLHTHARDLGTDRKTRVRDSAGPGRHAVEPRADLKQLAKEDFIGLVAEELAAEHGRDAFGRLMLIAPAGVLTQLKQKLAKPVADVVVQDLQKDLTNVPDHDLAEHLAPQ
ncbi:MAG TPA: host attachment protein [Methyloceanibacter sp.]|nr:host attachment protein [Methyloceanibacter sp.]